MALTKLRILIALTIVIYVISPIVFKYSTFIQRSLLFMNHVNTQYNFNLSQPQHLGIKCSRLLRLTNEHARDPSITSPDTITVELGAWHILPSSSLSSCVTLHDDNHTGIDDALAFADSRPIVLYVHGNGGNRAGNHRAKLYTRLAYNHDYHVITFDYRGYGDSSYLYPTADGISADARFVYNWLLSQQNVTKDRVTVWGHSLGTAVAVRMVADLPDDIKPKRLILEAPFDTMANAIANHPFATPFKVIPYFDYFFVEPVEKSPDMNFNSVEKIAQIKSTPILILHAEDDAIIPFKLGHNLYRKAAEMHGESQVGFVSIGANMGLGHKHICTHDETMTKVARFIREL